MQIAGGYCYGYLLGMYLGDGCTTSPKPTNHQLRVSLDAAYPEIFEECVVAVVLTTVGRPVYVCSRPGMRVRVIECSWSRWPELFPQHGPGRKHERRISLEPWQRNIVDAHPQQFLRGLIHSDGCRTTNRFKVALPSGRVREYEYPRYFFSNLSPDIRGLFCEYCERLGIRWTQSNHLDLAPAQRGPSRRVR